MSEFQYSRRYPNLHRWAVGVLAADLEAWALGFQGLAPLNHPDARTVASAHRALAAIERNP